jgi:hypothetical protein
MCGYLCIYQSTVDRGARQTGMYVYMYIFMCSYLCMYACVAICVNTVDIVAHKAGVLHTYINAYTHIYRVKNSGSHHKGSYAHYPTDACIHTCIHTCTHTHTGSKSWARITTKHTCTQHTHTHTYIYRVKISGSHHNKTCIHYTADAPIPAKKLAYNTESTQAAFNGGMCVCVCISVLMLV